MEKYNNFLKTECLKFINNPAALQGVTSFTLGHMNET